MDSAYQRHFGMRKTTSETPFSSAPSPAISSSPMQTRPRIQWNSQSRGSRGMAGVQSRNTISKDRIQGEEQRMAGLLAQHGNKVMRTQHTTLSVEPIDSDSSDDAADTDLLTVISATMKKLDDVSDDFHSNWLPLCLNYIDSPPKDAKKRDEEHRTLSDSIMQQIILKLDGVETEGVDEIRQRRKDLIRRVQEINGFTSEFNSNWLPLCRRYIESVPRGYSKRNDEHRRLAESSCSLKLDGVETEGDDELRQRRREHVRQVQDVLRKLDDAKQS